MSAGRPTDLTTELFGKIKQCILDGHSLRDTAKICEINESTLYNWSSENYLNLANKIEEWHGERRLGKSIRKIEELTDSENEKVALDASTFFAETLGKRTYSKKIETELSGNLNIYKWDGYNNDIQTQKLDQGVSRESSSLEGTDNTPESGQDSSSTQSPTP